MDLPPAADPPPRVDVEDSYLSIDTNGMALEEAENVIKQLRIRRTSRNDGVLPELWQ